MFLTYLMIKGWMGALLWIAAILTVTHLHDMYHYEKYRFTRKTLVVIFPDG